MSGQRARSNSEMLARRLTETGVTIAIAESCTGGLVAHMITERAGSSAYFKGAVVAYDNAVKRKLLGVPAATLERYGAVSKQTASAMAAGVRKKLKTSIGLAVTGIAGPGGGGAKKPVGTVFIAVADGKRVLTKKFLLKGTRSSIKKQAAVSALNLLEKTLA